MHYYFEYTMRLTHLPTGITAETQWNGDQSVAKQRKLLRQILASKVAAYQSGLFNLSFVSNASCELQETIQDISQLEKE